MRIDNLFFFHLYIQSMAYLIIDNNLGDIADPYEARLNLGLGDIATMSSNEVKITGGSIVADSFGLKPHTSLETRDHFLRNVDENGTVEWFQIPSLNWVDSNQKNVLISGFSNDAHFISRDELAKVAFTGDFNDLSNLPIDLREVYSNDVLNEFLYVSSNLSDISDKAAARQNIGIGDLGLQNSSNVVISNLTVTQDFTFPQSVGTGFVFIDANSNGDPFLSTIESLPLASSSNPGIVYTKDNIQSNASDAVPTMTLFSNVVNGLNSKIAEFKIGYMNDIVDLVEGDQFLFRSNLLSEFQLESEKKVARTNLGCGDICTQDSNELSCSNILVESIEFNINSNLQHKILSFDNSNKTTFASMHNFLASDDEPGAVFVSDEYDFATLHQGQTAYDHCNQTALSMIGVSNFLQSFNTRLSDIQTSIPTDILQLSGNNEYLRKQNNLSDLTDINMAKSNLGLAKVATTGAYADLTDKPFAISSFSNDLGFLVGDCNLSDIPDPIQARINLGLGSMATQDIHNVRIKGGIVRFKKLEIKNEFFYKEEDDVPNGKILVCADRNGLMEWKDLPKASFTTYGAVQVSDHIKYEDDRTDVVPTCKVFSVIEENLKSKLDASLRNYLLSLEFSDRLNALRMDQVQKIKELTELVDSLVISEQEKNQALSNLQLQLDTANALLQSNQLTIETFNSHVLELETTLQYTQSNLTILANDAAVLQENITWAVLAETIAPSGLSSGTWMIGSMAHGCSCSADGTRVIMSGMNHNYNDRGTAVAFEKKDGSWSQMGSPINGDSVGDLSGFSVSMSGDGTRIALGSPTYSTSMFTRNNTGRVVVYDWNSSSNSWSQTIEITGSEEGDNFGTSVALSADGARLACGAIKSSGSTAPGEVSGPFSHSSTQSKGWFYEYETTGAGIVRVYEFEPGTSTINMVGDDISGNAKSAFGWSIDLSGDGTRLVVGAPGSHEGGSSYTCVYEESGGVWSQVGNSPTGLCGEDKEGSSVSITNDGKRIATTAIHADSGSGRVRVYEEIEGAWSQVGATFLPSETGLKRIGLSLGFSKSDGKTIVFGNYDWIADEQNDPCYTVFKETLGVWKKYGARLITSSSVGSLAMSHDGKIVIIGFPESNGFDGTLNILQDPVV